MGSNFLEMPSLPSLIEESKKQVTWAELGPLLNTNTKKETKKEKALFVFCNKLSSAQLHGCRELLEDNQAEKAQWKLFSKAVDYKIAQLESPGPGSWVLGVGVASIELAGYVYAVCWVSDNVSTDTGGVLPALMVGFIVALAIALLLSGGIAELSSRIGNSLDKELTRELSALKELREDIQSVMKPSSPATALA